MKVSLRVRKRYFDLIVAGVKVVEYRKDSWFWKRRLIDNKPTEAVFLCGKRVHRREILGVLLRKTPEGFSEQSQRDVPTKMCYAIHLGSEVTTIVYEGDIRVGVTTENKPTKSVSVTKVRKYRSEAT